VKSFLNSTTGTALRALLAFGFGYLAIQTAGDSRISNVHWYVVGLLALVALFQLAVAAGLPLGEFTQGGQQIGRLDAKARRNAAASIAVVILFVITSLYLGGEMQLPELIGQALSYLFFAYLAVGLLVNSISRSIKESLIWTPLLLLNIYLVAILYFGS
jgi:hypothetical protein